MEQLEWLINLPLFLGVSRQELPQLLGFLQAGSRNYQAGELILLAGFETKQIFVVLEGQIEAERPNWRGDALPITKMKKGDVFGDVLSGGHTPSPVTVRAQTDCRVLFFQHQRLLQGGEGQPAAARTLLQNLVRTVSEKYFQLSFRVDLLLCRRLRDRIWMFLYQQGIEEGPVKLQMDRRAMAGWLGCERSALSRELSRMKKEGLIKIQGDCFALAEGSLKNVPNGTW